MLVAPALDPKIDLTDPGGRIEAHGTKLLAHVRARVSARFNRQAAREMEAVDGLVGGRQ